MLSHARHKYSLAKCISIGFSRIILCWCEIFEFQLEDNVWDDFGESDDHIVLHLSEYKEQFVTWGDS
ncbi:hypothetical protein ACOSQ3_004759 [Xanthoceras sorbifolium]